MAKVFHHTAPTCIDAGGELCTAEEPAQPPLVEAQRANSGAAAEARKAARALHAAKYTYRDIGAVMGVSHQRAEQLVKS